jgi:uncharacterized membrane protein (DUF485 family)
MSRHAYHPPHHAGPHPHSEIRILRRAYRRLRRTATFTALGYFVLFLLLSGYAPGLMAHRLSGSLTLGLFLGLLQLPVTLIALFIYERTAQRYVDPLSAAIRSHPGPPPPAAPASQPFPAPAPDGRFPW